MKNLLIVLFRPSILNFSAVALTILSSVIFIQQPSQNSDGLSLFWPIVFLVIAFLAIVGDLIFKNMIENQLTLNIIELIIVAVVGGYLYLLLTGKI